MPLGRRKGSVANEKFLTIQPSSSVAARPRSFSVAGKLSGLTSQSGEGSRSRSPQIFKKMNTKDKEESDGSSLMTDETARALNTAGDLNTSDKCSYKTHKLTDAVNDDFVNISCDEIKVSNVQNERASEDGNEVEEFVEEDEITVDDSDQVEGALSNFMNKFVEKISDTFQGPTKGVAEYRNYYDSSDNWQFAGGTQQGNVKRRIADIIQAENELDMGSSSLQVDSLHISKSNQKDDNVSHTSEYKPMTSLEKEWEFIMCSDSLDRVKKFLDAHPFQEEPNDQVRFVNYRSKINGNTVLHYAAQFGNTGMAAELVQNRGVDCSIINNIGMTALHTLAQYRPKSAEFGGVQKQADLSSPGVSKMIIMANMFLVPSIKKKRHMDLDGPEPTLVGPFVRDFYGRMACDLLSPEINDQYGKLRETFRVGVPDVDLAKNKDKPWKEPAKQATPVHKTSIFESIFGSSKQDSSAKNRGAPNQGLASSFFSGSLRKVSHGTPSSAPPRSLPMLSRSQSNVKPMASSVSSGSTQYSSVRRPLSHQHTSQLAASGAGAVGSPRRKTGVTSLVTSPIQSQPITEDQES
ncbi:uncharacterized protein LOC142349806 isoform X2 [Convolutriloba macropyga]|uniref:uncharacterized protein LOC142349806 isoform X2 n=1 Tax=Convolutriloba macropyga TaxID=536237 RepID=UPI003F5215E1